MFSKPSQLECKRLNHQGHGFKEGWGLLNGVPSSLQSASFVTSTLISYLGFDIYTTATLPAPPSDLVLFKHQSPPIISFIVSLGNLFVTSIRTIFSAPTNRYLAIPNVLHPPSSNFVEQRWINKAHSNFLHSIHILTQFKNLLPTKEIAYYKNVSCKNESLKFATETIW